MHITNYENQKRNSHILQVHIYINQLSNYVHMYIHSSDTDTNADTLILILTLILIQMLILKSGDTEAVEKLIS